MRSKFCERSGRVAAALAMVVVASQCAPSGPRQVRQGASDAAAAALKVYVAPGDLDPYYMFASGGHSGNVYVYGVPSMRHISTIPVFTPYPATGYGFDDDSKKMLGNLTWGDAHHPALSETNGDYDGRWLFINEMNGRVARIDLRDFKTKQILGPVPERLRESWIGVRHPEHRVRHDVDAVFHSDSEGHVFTRRQIRDRLQRTHCRRQDRSQEWRDDARVPDPDAAVRLRHRRRREEGLGRVDVPDRVQHRAGHRASSRSRPASATATTLRRSTGGRPRRPRPKAKGI